jgi:hypothetical protein
MFCAPRMDLGGTEGVKSLFHVLCSRIHFRRYRGRRVPYSCFARPDSFSAVPMASGPVFMFSAPGHVFSGNEGVRSRFHVLRSRTHFLRYRGRRVPFSGFALPDSFSAVPRASGLIFMFCAPGLIFGRNEGVGSRFHVLCAWPRFRRCRGRRVPFSCFARPVSFSAVPRASGPVLMFCAPEYFSKVPRASGPVFIFCAPGLILIGTEGAGSRFHLLRARPRFRRCWGHRVPFSCFALPN